MLERVLGAGVRLEFRADQELPPAPLGVRDLEALLQNLATNARDALAGRGAVRIALEALTTGAAAPGTRLIFEDDGPGFSEAALAHAFEPLYTTKATQRGSGLGLASVARSVRLAGGAVRALNRTPHGARIEIELPAAR
jgi:C4-dicarboxylate-specific signal transduction histidine kinase